MYHLRFFCSDVCLKIFSCAILRICVKPSSFSTKPQNSPRKEFQKTSEQKNYHISVIWSGRQFIFGVLVTWWYFWCLSSTSSSQRLFGSHRSWFGISSFDFSRNIGWQVHEQIFIFWQIEIDIVDIFFALSMSSRTSLIWIILILSRWLNKV